MHSHSSTRAAWRRALARVGLALLSTLASSGVAGQEPYRPTVPDPVHERWRWRQLPALEGTGLRSLAETADGILWFGVDAGVRRYDGARWTLFTPADGLVGKPINVLHAMPDGTLYAASDRGISRFADGAWSRVFPQREDLPWPIDGLTAAADGSLWAATAWGALHLAATGTTLYTSADMAVALSQIEPSLRLVTVPDAVATLRVWGEQRAWGEGVGVQTATGGFIGLLRGDAPLVIWALAPDGPAAAAGLQVGDHIVAVDGRPGPFRLAGPAGSEVTLTVERQGAEAPFQRTLTRAQLPGTCRDFGVYDIQVGRDGVLWLGLTDGDIVRYAPGLAAAAWRRFTADDGLSPGFSPRLLERRDGTLWAVSNSDQGLVNRFDGQWTALSLGDEDERHIHTALVETTDGALWIGGQSLAVLRDGTVGRDGAVGQDGDWRIYSHPQAPIPSERLRLLAAADGSLWLGGLGQGATRLAAGTVDGISSYEGLNFGGETTDGARWFLSREGHAVRAAGATWRRYGVEAGLMDTPSALLVTHRGELWAAGSHRGVAATAHFEDGIWHLETHPALSSAIHRAAVFEAADGALWFGGEGDLAPGQRGGVLRAAPLHEAHEANEAHSGGRRWTHFTPPTVPRYIFGIDQTTDGTVWIGGSELRRWDGRAWSDVELPDALEASWIDAVCAAPGGGLWVGTRSYGAFHYDGAHWKQLDVQAGLPENTVAGLPENTVAGLPNNTVAGLPENTVAGLPENTVAGLPDNTVHAILPSAHSGVWIVTRSGVGHFAEGAYAAAPLPLTRPPEATAITLRTASDGAVWLNAGTVGGAPLRTTRYPFDILPPDTRITAELETVPHRGHALLTWTGSDPWHVTPREGLLFSYRLDGGAWSPFSAARNHSFTALAGGAHRFEVRARDADLNIDPTPASLHFTVAAPLWRQPWLLLLLTIMVGALAVQTGRIAQRGRRLAALNQSLARNREDLEVRAEERSAELAATNIDLGKQIVERLRAEQALQERLRFEALLSQISTAFISLPAESIEQEIDRCLGIIGTHMQVDRVGVSLFAAEGSRLSSAFEWLAAGIRRGRDEAYDLAGRQFPWFFATLQRGEAVIIANAESIPPAATAAEHAFYRSLDLQSLIAVPMVGGGSVLGCVRFDAVRAERHWSDQLVQRLKLIGEIFANALLRKRAQQALRDSEARYRSIVEDQTELILRWQPDGTRTFVNGAYCRYYQLTHEAALGTNFLAQVAAPERQRIARKIAALTPAQPTVTDEHEVVLPDGTVAWHSWTDRGIFDETGQLLALQSVGRDITARRLAEQDAERHRQELVEAEKMIALGTLVSGVAHEVNNPNHFIMLNLPILREAWRDAAPVLDRYAATDPGFRLANIPYGDMREEVPELIEELYQGADRIRLIVAELRNYTRGERAQSMGHIDLNDALASALRLLAAPIRKATAHFAATPAADLPPVWGNLRRLEQVIINLILNACQALSSRDSAVRVVTRHDPATGRVILTVEDEGQGIPEAELARIEDPFFTTKRERGGTGLGLAVASRIVEEHKGTLTYTSTVDHGTTARLTLPAYRPEGAVP